MAYIGYEDIPARTINYRIVPALRKFYRADGTYDLFDIRKRQANCIHNLVNVGEAGIRTATSNNNPVQYGMYELANGINRNSTFTEIDLYKNAGMVISEYAPVSYGIYFKLNLNNRAGLYPAYFNYKGNSGYHNSYGGVFVHNNSTGQDDQIVSGRLNFNMTWTASVNSPASMWDYKDYEYVKTEWTNGSAGPGWTVTISFTAYFIHKYSVEHPLYRYYR